MRFLTFIASISLATIVFENASASPIESDTESTKVVDQIESPEFEVEDVIHRAPVYDVESAISVTQTLPRHDLEATHKLDMRLDYIIDIALKSRHSLRDSRSLLLQYKNSKLMNLIFGALSITLYSALGASGAALGAYIIHPNDSDLIKRAAIKGINCNSFDFVIQITVYIFQYVPRVGKFLYNGGLLFGPVLSTWLTTYYATNGNVDQQTASISAMKGMTIGFVSLAFKLTSDVIIYLLSRMVSKSGVQVKICRDEASVVWTMITSAIAGILATIVMDKNWVAGLFIALFSLNPSLIGLLPLIENKTLTNVQIL